MLVLVETVNSGVPIHQGILQMYLCPFEAIVLAEFRDRFSGLGDQIDDIGLYLYLSSHQIAWRFLFSLFFEHDYRKI